MKIGYLGHACYLVELSNGVNVLVDPLLTATLQDDTASVYPPRDVKINKLPDISLIIITHSHPGHLEIPSLALLSKDIPVYYPSDPAIEIVLDGLGYNNRAIIAPGNSIDISEDISCVFTGTAIDLSEVGILFLDKGRSFWYLADTNTTEEIRTNTLGMLPGQLDFMVTNYAGYNHDFFTHFRFDFPYQSVAASLEQVLKIRPRMVAPNFSGVSYLRDSSWINRFMFPLQAEQFLDDLRNLCPQETDFINMAPGDAVLLSGVESSYERGALDYVACTAGSASHVLDPTAGLPALCDPDIEGIGTLQLRTRTESFLRNDFMPWVLRARDSIEPIKSYAKLKMKFRLFVVYPDKSENSYLVDFSDLSAGFLVEGSEKKNAPLTMRICASILDQWRRAEIPYFKVYHYARSYNVAYSILSSLDNRVGILKLDGSDQGEVQKGLNGRDPLSVYFNHDASLFYYPWLSKTVAKYKT